MPQPQKDADNSADCDDKLGILVHVVCPDSMRSHDDSPGKYSAYTTLHQFSLRLAVGGFVALRLLESAMLRGHVD